MQRECPECHAPHGLVVDYAAGCIVCDECATVVRYGLTEDPNNIFDEEQTGIDVDNVRGGTTEAGGGGAGKTTAAQRKALSAIDRYKGKVMKAIYLLRDNTASPDSVVESAMHYMSGFADNTRALNLKTDRPEVLAAGCFMLSSAKWRRPIQSHEVLKHLEADLSVSGGSSGVTVSRLEDMRRRLVEALNLKEEVAELSNRLIPDLAALYLGRLQMDSPPWPMIVSGMAQRYTTVVGDSNLSASARVAAMIFVAKTSTTISSKFTNKPPLTVDEEKAFLARLCRVSYEREETLRNCRKLCVEKPDNINKLLGVVKVRTPLCRDRQGQRR